MGPPGGGRNTITGRLTRHFNVLSIDSFDDATMIKIFSAIADWHFAQGYDPVFTRLGKVRLSSVSKYSYVDSHCVTSFVAHTVRTISWTSPASCSMPSWFFVPLPSPFSSLLPPLPLPCSFPLSSPSPVHSPSPPPFSPHSYSIPTRW